MNREEILLKEYEICQQGSQAEASSFWTIFGIFVSVNTAVMGGIAYGLFNTNFINEVLNTATAAPTIIKLTILTVLFAVIILITKLLGSWLGRANYNIRSNNHRAQEIEIELGMWKNLYIHIIDRWNSVRKELKYKSNPCNSQNNEIWVRVWETLSAEFSKDLFGSLYKRKKQIEAMSSQKGRIYFRPNRENAAIIFWGISSFWIVILTALWALFLSHYSDKLSLLIYVIPAIVIAIEYPARKEERSS